MNHTVTKILDLAYFHFKMGRHAQVRRLCGEVLATIPDHPEALYLLAKTAYACGDFNDALQLYGRLLSQDPDSSYYDDYYEAVCAAMTFDEGIGFFVARVESAPQERLAFYYLGCLYIKKLDGLRAAEAFQSALALCPEYAGAYAGLAEALDLRGEVFAALDARRRAIEFDPANLVYLNDMAGNLKAMGKAHEAVDYYRRAIDLSPHDRVLHSNHLINLLCTTRLSPEEIYGEHLLFAEQCANQLAEGRLPCLNDPSPDRPITVGYLSGDFRCHPVAFFIEPVLACHDRSAFRIVLYANHAKPDYITEQFRQFGFEWRDVAKMPDDELANLIRHDNVDLLVDLAGHTRSNRLLLFARKPAPVQVTWLGYANTTGLDVMDFRITDTIADPPGMTEHLHTEELWRLPGCFLCYRPPQNPPDVGPSPFIEKGYVTFASFNHFAKVTPQMLTIWGKILTNIPGSRLIIKSPGMSHPPLRNALYEQFLRAGIMAERIEMLEMLPSVHDHLAFFNQVDIALDTYPYNGTTTTCEALWMGVPVISLAGRSHVSRVGTSLLTNIGLADLAAESDDEYIAKACALALDSERLACYRNSLREMMQHSQLMDIQGFTRNLELAYRKMWQRWCGQNK
jgi:protein O-GlcNAc transferase